MNYDYKKTNGVIVPVIMPVDENLALTGSGSIGRRSGESIIFEERDGDTYFEYAGYVYRKIEKDR